MAFVNLNKRIDRSSRYQSASRKKRSPKKIIWTVVIFLLVLFVAIYLPLRGAYQSSKKMVAAARNISAAAKQENLDQIRANLKIVQSSSKDLNTSLNMLFWVRVIPFVGDYYADAKHFSKAGEYELTATNTLADSLDPYKNELGFTGVPTPGTDRVTQAVKILDKVIPQLDKIEPQLKSASEEVSTINTSKYPDSFGKYKVKSQVEAAKSLIMGAYIAVSQNRGAIEAAPAILGEPTAKNYLLIFQNDKELRATGGFMTAYAFMKLDRGRLSSTGSDDIYRLDEKLLEVCKNVVCPLTPPAPIVKYLPEVDGKPRTAWSMRDSNLSPDVPTSMKAFEKMYSYLPGAEKFDGIVLIDTHVVEDLIKITGPIEVFGTTYSAENDSRCNCANVIYELERYSQIIEKGENDRKAILGTLMQQILARTLSTSVDKLPVLLNTGINLANSKHMIIYLHDNQAQDQVSKLGWTGQIKDTSGDYLHINDSNFAGGKSNLYVDEDVLLEIDTKDPSNIKHKLTINYKNPQPYNTWLNGINRDYIRVYVPQGAKLTKSAGSDVAVTTIPQELGKSAFEAFIQIRPQNSRKLELEYTVSGNFSGKEYPLLIQKQPGTRDFDYEIKVNGVSKEKFQLDTDKEFKINT